MLICETQLQRDINNRTTTITSTTMTSRTATTTTYYSVSQKKP